MREYTRAMDISEIIGRAEEGYGILTIMGTINPGQGEYPFLSVQMMYQNNGLSSLKRVLKHRRLMEENDLEDVTHTRYIMVLHRQGHRDGILDEMVG